MGERDLKMVSFFHNQVVTGIRRVFSVLIPVIFVFMPGMLGTYARPFGMVLRRCDEAFVSSQKPFEKKNEVAASR